MFQTLIYKELLEQYRTRRVAIVSIVLVFMALSSALLAKLMPDLLKSFQTPGMTITITSTTSIDAIDQFVKNVSQLGIFVLLFVVSGAIAEERTRKTLELLLVKPVSRTQVVLAKFTAYLGVIALILLASSVIFSVYSYSLFGSFPFVRFAGVTALLLGFTLSTLGVTIAASSMARTSLGATGIGFAWVILSSIATSLTPSLGRYLPAAVFSVYHDLVTNGWQGSYSYPLVSSILILLASIAIATNRFSKQEIER